MSEVYIKEPPTSGKVVLVTTHGDLEVELWANEAPKACRNFCTLALEGYYDDTIFHRIIKDYIVQGGDASGTGQGCETIYGEPYPDEIHPRLKFRYRGMMGVASAGRGSKSNGSQFFISLGRAPSLDGKHTLFGRVAGQTVYNLVRLAEVEVDKDDHPVEDPPRILRVELVWDPFGDLEPRRMRAPPPPPKQLEEKEHRREAVKNKNTLSFGSDDEFDTGAKDVNSKLQSAHDALSDPRLLREAAYEVESKSARGEKRPIDSARARSGADGGASKQLRERSRRARDIDDSSEDSGSEAEHSGHDVASDRARERQKAIQQLKVDIKDQGKSIEQHGARVQPKTALEECRAGFTVRTARVKIKGKQDKDRAAKDVASALRDFQARLRSSTGTSKTQQTDENGNKAEHGTFASIWQEGDEEGAEDWLAGGGLSFHVSADRAFQLESQKGREQLEIFDPLAASGNAEVLAEVRRKVTDKMRPERRRPPEKEKRKR